MKRIPCFAAGLAALCVLAAGCGGESEPHPAVLIRALEHGLKHEWDAAQPLIREYLLGHPEDAGAHWLWGCAHLHRKQPWMSIADGEFETALALLRKSGDPGAIRHVVSAGRFEGMIYEKKALIHMRLAHEILAHTMPEHMVRPHLQKALVLVRKGRNADPASRKLREMEETLEKSLPEKYQPETGTPGKKSNI
jgi:hypothetical protein